MTAPLRCVGPVVEKLADPPLVEPTLDAGRSWSGQSFSCVPPGRNWSQTPIRDLPGVKRLRCGRGLSLTTRELRGPRVAPPFVYAATEGRMW